MTKRVARDLLESPLDLTEACDPGDRWQVLPKSPDKPYILAVVLRADGKVTVWQGNIGETGTLKPGTVMRDPRNQPERDAVRFAIRRMRRAIARTDAMYAVEKSRQAMGIDLRPEASDYGL